MILHSKPLMRKTFQLNNMIELISNIKCKLAECPLWNVQENRLYFTDIEQYCIWRLDPQTGNAEKFYNSQFKIGGFAFNNDGTLILCAESHVFKLYKNGETEKLYSMTLPSSGRFNDITTDPAGRIYAGTMNDGLFLFEKDKKPVTLIEKVNCSNGMTFSLDEKTFYHAVTKDCVINCYDYDRATGGISSKREFFNSHANNEWPDGLTIDLVGCLWVAFWSGGIKRISPDGKVIHELKIPAKNPTSVMFGGKKLGELFITTASGEIFRIKPETGGRREWEAKF